MNADLYALIHVAIIIGAIALMVWLFLAGGPCTGPAGDVPSWCFV